MDDKRAIEAALESRWQDALKLNKQIIKIDPENVDAFNRQARAYMELGKFNLAKKYYSQVLKFDPYNPIALKNLKIIKAFKTKKNYLPQNGQIKLSSSLFLQEPGKTKVVSLLNICEPQKLSQAFCGMKVLMTYKNRKITIVDANGDYLGVLPDDTSHLLTRLIKGGNKYELFIKSIRVNALAVLIRETFRSKRFKNQSSFLEYSASSFPQVEMITPPEFNEEATEGESEEEEQLA